MAHLTQNPNDGIEHAAVIYPPNAARIVRQHRLMAVHSCSLNWQRMIRDSGFINLHRRLAKPQML
jgi:alkylated DNA nucleotide flippase Atl1